MSDGVRAAVLVARAATLHQADEALHMSRDPRQRT
jgi:hypothetical protein